MSRTLLLVLALVGGIYGYEYVTVTRPAAQAMAEDYRNDNVPLVADLKGLGTSRLRLNVDSDGAGEASPADLSGGRASPFRRESSLAGPADD